MEFRFVRVVLLLCVAVCGLGAYGQGNSIRFMTFNIKGDDGSFGSQFSAAQSWIYLGGAGAGRKERAMEEIRVFGPDILAVQELKNNQLSDIRAAFPEYEWFGQGRDGGDNGDRSGFFYRTSRFSLSDTGSFWLSETPTVASTTFHGTGTDTGNPRKADWAKLFDAQTNVQFFILTTHWSLDDQARLESATLIRDTIEDLRSNLPVIVMGDLNEVENSAPYNRLTGQQNFLDVQLVDAYREVNVSSVYERTYHNWGAYGTMGDRVDHIFHSQDDFITDSAWIDRWTDPANGYYPSDHFPVKMVLRYDASLLGRDAVTAGKVRVYPVPAKDRLFLDGIEDAAWEIVDVQGRVLAEGAHFSAGCIAVGEIPSGMYLLRLKDGSAVRFIKG